MRQLSYSNINNTIAVTAHDFIEKTLHNYDLRLFDLSSGEEIALVNDITTAVFNQDQTAILAGFYPQEPEACDSEEA